MSTFTKARIAAVSVGTAAIMATGAAAASATTLSNAGGALATGSTISAPLSGTATLNTAFGPSSCTTGTIGATVTGANPAPTVALGSPVFTLGTCSGPTSTSSPFRIFSATLSSATSISAVAPSTIAGADGDLNIAGATIQVRIGVPRTAPAPTGTCNMTVASVKGALRNSDNSVTFSGVNISSATGVCAQALPANFTATFKPLTSGGSAVTIAP